MCEGTPLTVKLATGGHPRKVSKLGLPNFQQMCYGQQGSWIRRDGLTWNQSPLFESQLHRSTSALGLPPTSVPACPLKSRGQAMLLDRPKVDLKSQHDRNQGDVTP